MRNAPLNNLAVQPFALKNFNIKVALMASHRVDTGHTFDHAETKILSHANNWTARAFKEAWHVIETQLINA